MKAETKAEIWVNCLFATVAAIFIFAFIGVVVVLGNIFNWILK